MLEAGEATCMAVDYSQLVLANGTTPHGAYWFIVNLQNTETRVSGTERDLDVPWWEQGIQKRDEEALEVIYVELDPERNIAAARLLSMHVPFETPEEADAREKAVQDASEHGESSGFAKELYLYEAMTNVAPAVALALETWSEEPYPLPDVPDYALERWRRAGDVILGHSPTQAAIQAAVANSIHKWKQAPYLSGTRWVVPEEVFLGTESEVAERLFNVDTGFYGIEPP